MTITTLPLSDRPTTGRAWRVIHGVRWALEEIGLPYEVRLLSFQAKREPEHLRLHPFGLIPTYEDGDLAPFETGAVILHIGERRPGLLPHSAHGRSRAIAGCSPDSIQTSSRPLSASTCFSPHRLDGCGR